MIENIINLNQYRLEETYAGIKQAKLYKTTLDNMKTLGIIIDLCSNKYNGF